MTIPPTLSPEEVAGYFDLDWGFSDRLLPAVLDTSCVRTGLHYQLANGEPPASVKTARDGAVRLFMEYDTLTETKGRLPRFASQFKVPEDELRRILDEDWLPYIQVVKLPPSARQLDKRALKVYDADADDYPAAALAALLSPCILLTHNYKDFAALGVRTDSQGVDAVMAVIDVMIGRMHVNATLMVPALPITIAGATGKWAAEKIGPGAWLILAVLVAGGIFFYLRQPEDRRERIKEFAGKAGAYLLDEYTAATAEVAKGRLELHACLVPKPEVRSGTSAVLRELAVAPKSLSAQQLVELVDHSLRPPVPALRAYLRANEVLFTQVRRGGFVLGRQYRLDEV